MNSPEIKVTALVDAVVESLSDGRPWSRTDVHIAILNHSMMEIVRAGETSAPGPNEAKDRVTKAMLDVLDTFFPIF